MGNSVPGGWIIGRAASREEEPRAEEQPQAAATEPKPAMTQNSRGKSSGSRKQESRMLPTSRTGVNTYNMENKRNRRSDNPRKLPYKLIKRITNNFSEELGRGAFGQVFKGVLEDGEEVAVKMLRVMGNTNDQQFENEFEILKRLEHPNIVRLVGFCDEAEDEVAEYKGKLIVCERIHMALCLEYMPNGSLGKLLSGENLGNNWPIRYKIIKGICKGLRYLQEGLEFPIFHFDLKPDNILLDERMIPKISDFGLSRLIGEESTKNTLTHLGTIGYLPPEFINYQVISKEYDIYSLGVIVTKIITGTAGYSYVADMGAQEFVEHVHENWKKYLQKIPNYASLEVDCKQVKRCIEIARRCMENDRHKRPKIKDIVSQLDEIEMENFKLHESGVTEQPQPRQDVGEQVANHTHVHGVPGYYKGRVNSTNTAAAPPSEAAPVASPAPAAQPERNLSWIEKCLMCITGGRNARSGSSGGAGGLKPPLLSPTQWSPPLSPSSIFVEEEGRGRKKKKEERREKKEGEEEASPPYHLSLDPPLHSSDEEVLGSSHKDPPASEGVIRSSHKDPPSEISHSTHPEHKLKLMTDAGAPFMCDGCKEPGYGPRYACDCGGGGHTLDLHTRCALAEDPLFDLHTLVHPLFGYGRQFEFRFLHEPPAPAEGRRVCDACGEATRGFVYHSLEEDLDLHPCCASLPDRFVHDGRAFDLHRRASRPCALCPGNEGRRRWFWAYRCNLDGDEAAVDLHVACLKETARRSWEIYCRNRDVCDGAQINVDSVLENMFSSSIGFDKFGEIAGTAASFITALVLGNQIVKM